MLREEHTMADTRELIKTTFAQMYLEQGLAGLSVSRVCTAIPMARSTFYAYYTDLYAVLDEIIAELIENLYRINTRFRHTDLGAYHKGLPMAFVDDTLAYIKDNQLYFRALLRNSESLFIYKWKQIISHHFREKFMQDRVDIRQIDLVLECIASSVIGSYTYWVNHLEQVPVEDLKDILMRCVCGAFFQGRLHNGNTEIYTTQRPVV